MLGNGGYAMKKRKKPVQKSLKAPPGEKTVKTNPSKRHRDRLNGELDRLTSLLPFSEEVRGRLDKLSVLRLSVGYLKVKSYFHVTLQKNSWSTPSVSAKGRTGQATSLDGVALSEGDLLLQALNGFVMVVLMDGSVFYTSPTVQEFLGFHQSDVVHQSVYDLVHMDDRDLFRCQLHFALNPKEADAIGREDALQRGGGGGGGGRGKAARGSQCFLPQHIPPENSSFLERNFCCRLRCLLDNSSGFLALNFQGRLKYLQGHGQTGEDGVPRPAPLALFAIATPVQPPCVMEIRTKTLIFQTKHRMDFAPLGIDTRGKVVLGYSETELITKGSGYQFIHAADMMYCADNHLKMIKTGESGFSSFRLLTKQSQWVWVQANARVVFKAGRPDFIIARQKPLTNEEGEEHLRQRRLQVPFNFATGEGVLYDSCVSLDSLAIPGPPGPPGPEQRLDPASMLGSLLRQDRSIYAQPPHPEPSPPLPLFPPPLEEEESAVNTLDRAFLDSHALLSVPGQLHGSQNRPDVIGDPTSQAMLDSLEQILGEIGDGGIEGLEVEETDLRDWESALRRMNMERGDVSRELDDFLANDVFSYVEEALKRETAGGCLKNTEQAEPPVAVPIDGFSAAQLPDRPHGGSLLLPGDRGYYGPNGSHAERQWQLMTDMNSNLSGFAEPSLMGDALGVVGSLSVLKRESHSRTIHRLTESSAARQGDASHLWPPNGGGGGGGYLCGNQPPSGPSRNAVVSRAPESPPDQTWTPVPVRSADAVHGSHRHHAGSEAVVDRSVRYGLALLSHAGVDDGQTTCGEGRPPYAAPQARGPAQPWQHTQWQPREQPPQSLHRLAHLAQTPLDAHSKHRAQTTQPFSGSCMFEKREGGGVVPPAPSLPARQSRPLPTPPAGSRGPPLAPFAPAALPPAPSLPARQSRLLPTPAGSRGPPLAPFAPAALPTDALSQPGGAAAPGSVWSRTPYQGMKQLSHVSPQMVPYTGSTNGSQLSGESSNLGAVLTGFPPENGSIQTSFFYWNGETQMPGGPPNGGVEPFTFSALPNGSANITQRTGP